MISGPPWSEIRIACIARRLSAQHHFQRRPAPRHRVECEHAADRSSTRLHVLHALSGAVVARLEALAVVADAHEALRFEAPDPDFGVGCACMLPYVGEAFLDDAEDLDLLVWSELDAGIDLQLDGELAVGGQDVEVTTERGVERRVAAGRRERQD